MNLVELDFINRISHSLELFHWTSQSKAALCRCPLCGDSATNTRKTRGSFFFSSKEDKYFYHCFNCGASMSFRSFLKNQFPSVYPEFKLEIMKDSFTGSPRSLPVKNKPAKPYDPSIFLKPITQDQSWLLLSELEDTHPAVIYAKSRQIPEYRYPEIGYAQNWAKFVCELDPAQLEKKLPTDARLVFIMKTKMQRTIGVQGRAIDPEAKTRFSTVKFDDFEQKSYGLDRINEKLPVFVTEAIIDSLFLDNSLAIVGGDVTESLLEGLDRTQVYLALDNEPRHKDTVNRMEKAIRLGINVCFWKIDSSLKDINAMVLAGIDRHDIMDNIKSNSLRGLAAQMKLKTWRKV